MLTGFTELLPFMAEGAHNITIWILVFLSVISVACILERFIVLTKIHQSSQKMVFLIQDILQSYSLSEIKNVMKRRRTSIEGKALDYGLNYVKKKGLLGLEEGLNSFFLLEKIKLEKRLNFLATVGSNAPFIGLLGTVFGVMEAFRSLAYQGETNAVMLGISRALFATAVGLLVALPAVIAYNTFQKKVKSILQGFASVKDFCLLYAKTMVASQPPQPQEESLEAERT